MKLTAFILLLLSLNCQARVIEFAWDYPADKSLVNFELRMRYNNGSWETISTPLLTAAKDIPLKAGDLLQVEVRAVPRDLTILCGSPPATCSPSDWITFNSVRLGTPIVYPKTPDNIVLSGWNNK